jgi:hypothetical protein
MAHFVVLAGLNFKFFAFESSFSIFDSQVLWSHASVANDCRRLAKKSQYSGSGCCADGHGGMGRFWLVVWGGMVAGANGALRSLIVLDCRLPAEDSHLLSAAVACRRPLRSLPHAGPSLASRSTGNKVAIQCGTIQFRLSHTVPTRIFLKRGCDAGCRNALAPVSTKQRIRTEED